MKNPPELMNLTEAGRLVGVTMAGMRRIERRGCIEAVAQTLPEGKRASQRLFRRVDVERIAEARVTLRMADRRRSPNSR